MEIWNIPRMFQIFHVRPVPNILWKSIHTLLCNIDNRQTKRQEAKKDENTTFTVRWR